MRNLLYITDKRLYLMGFQSPTVRRLLLIQIMVSVVALTGGALLVFLTPWALFFGIGASMAAYNFWHLARFVQNQIYKAYSPATSLLLFFGFSSRFIITGLVLFICIVWLHAPISALVAGLSFPICCIVLWGISKCSNKPVKEA